MDGIDASSHARPRYLAVVPDMDHAASAATQDEFTRLFRAESFRLLAGEPAGRLIYTSNVLPAVRPMKFALVDGLIVLRTTVGTTIARYQAVPPVSCAPGAGGQFVTITTELVEGLRVSESPASSDGRRGQYCLPSS